jgi:hypothetical protein
MAQPPPNPNTPPKRQIRLEIPNKLEAIYSNAVMISQTHSEIVMDFIQMMPNDPRARVRSRVVMTPANAKSFLDALKVNLDRFEEKHGEIVLPPKPSTLADQLFGAVKMDDESDDNDDDSGSE